MNERHRFGVAAWWAAPLLAGCLVRWESSPENDENWDPSPSSPAEGAGFWSEPPPSRNADGDARPPLTSESEYPPSPELDAESALGDRYRDLIVIDPEIVAGPFATSDADDAPFSFRAQMQWLAGGTSEPLEFTRSWLLAWENTSEVGPVAAPVAPRPRLRRVLVDPWLVASGMPPTASTSSGTAGYGDRAGDATDAAAYGAADTDPHATVPGEAPLTEPAYDDSDASWPLPSWRYAPFRLIAIVNRVDLASGACEGYAGEVRYVYAGVDPESSVPLELTLILEVPYPTTRPAAEWARAWRDLAALPPGEAYTRELVALMREIRAEADPLRARLRTNEIALSDPARRDWEMREFNLQIRSGALVLAQVPLEFTPRADADPAELSSHVLEHAEEIEGAGVSLPENLRAGAAQIDAPDFSWSVLGVSERLRRAFSVQTCNGCHGGDTASLPFRHIGQGASLRAPARLSRFMYDPDAGTDELRRRSRLLEELSATECAATAPSEPYTGG